MTSRSSNLLLSVVALGVLAFAALARPEPALLAHAGVRSASGTSPDVGQAPRDTTAAPDAAAAATDDLPALEPFLERMRARLRRDDQLVNDYTFTQTVTDRERDGDGAVKKTTVKVYEVYPGEEIGYRRLISENGKPTPADVLTREDEKQRNKVEEFLRNRREESQAQRARRLAKEQKEREEEEEQIAELFRIMEGRLVGREQLGSVRAIVLAFSPRPDVKSRSTVGKILKNVEGRAWFTDDDYQLVKVDLRIIDTVSFGWGVFARLHEGATVTFERREVEKDAWLPARYQLMGTGRVLLFKGIRMDTEVKFSDYRKATARTTEAFAVPR